MSLSSLSPHFLSIIKSFLSCPRNDLLHPLFSTISSSIVLGQAPFTSHPQHSSDLSNPPRPCLPSLSPPFCHLSDQSKPSRPQPRLPVMEDPECSSPFLSRSSITHALSAPASQALLHHFHHRAPHTTTFQHAASAPWNAVLFLQSRNSYAFPELPLDVTSAHRDFLYLVSLLCGTLSCTFI